MLSNMLGFLVQSQYQNNCRGDVYQGAGVLTSSPLSVCRSWVLTQVKGWFSVWFSWVKACLAEQGRCPQILSFGSKVEDCHWVIVEFSGKILRFRWFWRDLEGFWQVNRGRPSVSFPAPPGFVRVFPTGAGAVTCQVFLFGVGGGWIVCRWSRESMAINVLFIYIYTYLFIKFIKMIQDVCVFGSQVLLITTVGQVSPRLVWKFPSIVGLNRCCFLFAKSQISLPLVDIHDFSAHIFTYTRIWVSISILRSNLILIAKSLPLSYHVPIPVFFGEHLVQQKYGKTNPSNHSPKACDHP